MVGRFSTKTEPCALAKRVFVCLAHLGKAACLASRHVRSFDDEYFTVRFYSANTANDTLFRPNPEFVSRVVPSGRS